MKPQKHFFRLAMRALYLIAKPTESSAHLIRESYNAISSHYDDAWTHHTRDLTDSLLATLSIYPNMQAIDLGCGTGYISQKLVERGAHVTGIDSSPGMLEHAATKLGNRTKLVESDALSFLRGLESNSVDLITSGWNLGYMHPAAVIRQSARALRPGGTLAVIDNSLWSLREIVWSSILTFSEQPDALAHVLRVRFLASRHSLAGRMLWVGLHVSKSWSGSRTFYVQSGKAALERLHATGAAAGFEFAAHPGDRDRINERFATILSERYRTDRGIPVTHRYIAAVATKP